MRQQFFFEHVPQGSIGLDLEYNREILAWDFAAQRWVKRLGCRRSTGPHVDTGVRKAVEALEEKGSILVVWDAFPWMVGLMWALDPSLWAAIGKTTMVSNGRSWPKLRDEFIGWFPNSVGSHRAGEDHDS